MLRFILFLLGALGFTLFASQPKPKANQANTDDMWVTSPIPELPIGVTHHTFRSQSMKRDVGYCIYLPPIKWSGDALGGHFHLPSARPHHSGASIS